MLLVSARRLGGDGLGLSVSWCTLLFVLNSYVQVHSALTDSEMSVQCHRLPALLYSVDKVLGSFLLSPLLAKGRDQVVMWLSTGFIPGLGLVSPPSVKSHLRPLRLVHTRSSKVPERYFICSNMTALLICTKKFDIT